MLRSYIPTEDQDVDILMKALTMSKFKYHRGRIGVVDNPYLVERECWDCNKMMSLVKRVAFTKWARRLFLAQSLFLDMLIMFYELQDAICGWLVKLEKYMDFYF